RVVGEVRVHLEEEVVAALEAPAEPLEIRGAEAELACAVNHVDARTLPREGVCHFAGAVGRGVVDDQDIEALVLFEDHGHDTRQVVPLVVCRNDDESAFEPVSVVHGVSRNSRFSWFARTGSRSQGNAARGSSSAAVNQRRDATAMTMAAEVGTTCASSAVITPSRTPTPAGARRN